MDSELQTKLLGWVDNIVDLAATELPDIAMQYVTWGVWSGLFQAVVFGSVSAVCFCFTVLFFRTADTHGDDLVGPGIITLIGALFFAALTFGNLYDATKAYVAPKVYLIDKLRK